jgi:hypothetical protein
MEDLTSIIESAEKAKNNQSYFSAAIYYKNGLNKAIKNNDSKSIKLCRKMIVEMNKKSIDSGKDYQTIESEAQFSETQQEQLRKHVESIVKIEDTNQILKMIGRNPHYCPNIDEVEIQSKESIPIFSILGTSTTISSDGHVLRGSSDPQYAWFAEIYRISQGIIMSLYLNRIFYMLIKDKKITSRSLPKYFYESKLFDEDHLKIITIGLKCYLKKDYVSALHILIPQFEAFLLSIAQQFQLDIVAHEKKGEDVSTRTIILSENHLDSDGFQKVFGKNYCRQVKFVLFEQMGYKLRHKLAHGDIKSGECNFQNATLILYLYLYLLGRFKKKEK